MRPNSTFMLITFKISNFLSFDSQIEFFMQAGTVRDLNHHLIRGKGRNEVDILKSAVIYGANASGKSNFIKAIEFSKSIIEEGLTNISTENKYFRLNKANLDKPTQFEFEFKHNDKMYAYGVVLSLKDRKIREEWLFELLKTTDKPVFERKVLENGKSDIELGLKLNLEGKNRFEVYKKDIKDTQLFLSEVNDKNIDEIPNIKPFRDAFDWFKNGIIIIHPDTKLNAINFVGNNESMSKAFSYFLGKFKTGVQEVETIEEDIDGKFTTEFEETILNSMNQNQTRTINVGVGKNTFTFSKNEKGELKMYTLNTKRGTNDTKEMINFEVGDESDGTRRLMDFIPALVRLSNSNVTYLIDEIDRSLHPELTQKILESFFANTVGIESQLIVTTHESSLLDLSLLRRDEIWFVEKGADGASHMYSLEQFKPRHDKEVRKSYLQGRFGAIPFVSNVEALGWLNKITQN